MKPHAFGAKPTHPLMLGHPNCCGHVDTEVGLVCGRERDHADHIELDAEASLARRMAGAPRA
jgi:hypothetical protein